jgi:hypothetical protein
VCSGFPPASRSKPLESVAVMNFYWFNSNSSRSNARFCVSLFVRPDQFLFVGIDHKHGQQACGLRVTGICTDGMMIVRYFGPALAGAIHLFRPVIHFATNRTLQDRCIDESRVWMGVRGSGADLVIWAVNRFMHELPEGVEVVNLVHDEVDAIVTRETLKATVDVVARAFQETFAGFYPSLELLPAQHDRQLLGVGTAHEITRREAA